MTNLRRQYEIYEETQRRSKEKIDVLVQNLRQFLDHYVTEIGKKQPKKSGNKYILSHTLYGQYCGLGKIAEHPDPRISVEINTLINTVTIIQQAFTNFIQGVEKNNKRLWPPANKKSRELFALYEKGETTDIKTGKKIIREELSKDTLAGMLKTLESLKDELATKHKRFLDEWQVENQRAEKQRRGQASAKQMDLMKKLFSEEKTSITFGRDVDYYTINTPDTPVIRKFVKFLLKDDDYAALVKSVVSNADLSTTLQLDSKIFDEILSKENFDALFDLKRTAEHLVIEELESKNLPDVDPEDLEVESQSATVAAEDIESGRFQALRHRYGLRIKENNVNAKAKIDFCLNPSNIDFVYYLIVKSGIVLESQSDSATKRNDIPPIITLTIDSNKLAAIYEQLNKFSKSDQAQDLHYRLYNGDAAEYSRYLLKIVEINRLCHEGNDARNKGTLSGNRYRPLEVGGHISRHEEIHKTYPHTRPTPRQVSERVEQDENHATSSKTHSLKKGSR